MNPQRTAWPVALLAGLVLALPAAEPLVCRGFPAATAAEALAGRSGRPVLLDEADDAARPVWFVIHGSRQDEAAQALAHAIGCWWSTVPDGPLRLGRAPRLAPGRQEVRAYPSPLGNRPSAEGIALQLMDPWLGGSGGLVLEPGSGSWSATLDSDGHAQAAWLLTALAAPVGQAPQLLPDPADPGPLLRLPRPPAGGDLFAWLGDLSRLSGLSVTIGPDADHAQAPPAAAPATLGEAVAALGSVRLAAVVSHGCLCVGAATPGDRRHPAQRRSLAVVPVRHLCRADSDLEDLAAQLAARVEPTAWRLPGWGIAPLPWTRSLLVAGDPAAIHAVLGAIEHADAIGLQAWLR